MHRVIPILDSQRYAIIWKSNASWPRTSLKKDLEFCFIFRCYVLSFKLLLLWFSFFSGSGGGGGGEEGATFGF